MNYQKHYDALIERAKNRLLEGYCERHHIIPRCMGGNNAANNLVDLTAEEHYVAHQLLVKIYPDNSKLVYAAHMMTVAPRSSGSFIRNNKQYQWIRKKMAEIYAGENNPAKKPQNRKKLSIAMKERLAKNPESNPMKNEEIRDRHKQKMNLLFSGKNNPTHRPEVLEKMSSSMIEFYKNNPEAKETISLQRKEWHKNNPDKHPSKNKDTREKMSNSLKETYKNNPELRMKRSIARKEYLKNNPDAIKPLIAARKKAAKTVK
jgi:hypothetical protein